MLHALVLLTFVGCALACAPALACTPAPLAPDTRASAHSVPRAPLAAAPAEPAQALVSECQAKPSTVYGDEAVVFDIHGSHAAGLVSLVLRDERGRVVAQDRARVPGRWQPALPVQESGDFRLEVVSRGVECRVTVNRELSRATEFAR